jgi:hypothetical protein
LTRVTCELLCVLAQVGEVADLLLVLLLLLLLLLIVLLVPLSFRHGMMSLRRQSSLKVVFLKRPGTVWDSA